MRQLDPGAPVVRVEEVGGRGGGVADQDPALRGRPAIVVLQLASTSDVKGLLLRYAEKDGFI